MGYGTRHWNHPATANYLTGSVYPGFKEFSTYFDSCSSGFPEFTPGVSLKGDTIWFGEDVARSDPHGADDSVGPVEEMDEVLNRTEFQWMWHLLPAGTDAFTAFIQLYTMRHASSLDLSGHTATITIRVAACLGIFEQQVEKVATQAHRMTLGVYPHSWGTREVTICLAGTRAKAAATSSEVAVTASDGTVVSASFDPNP